MYTYDNTNYLHYFTVPEDGVYLIHALINFTDGISKSMSLYGRIERNGNEQSRQPKTIGGYAGANYIFLYPFSAGIHYVLRYVRVQDLQSKPLVIAD